MIDTMTKTYQEVLQEIENLKKEAESIRKSEIASAIAEVKALMEKYGLSVEDLGFGKKKSDKKAAKSIKYRSDTNPADTYGGKGPLPAWLKEKLAQGRNKEEFLVVR